MQNILFKSISLQGKRSNNEDYATFYQGHNISIFVVCDGVGGHQKGEVASQTVAESIKNYFIHQNHSLQESNIHSAVQFAITQLNEKVKVHPEAVDMATTLAYLGIEKQKAIISWAGDSRIYHFRNKKIIFRSEDDSYVNMLIKAGEITPEQARTHPQRNLITKVISPQLKKINLSFHHTEIKEGDYFLLCTDGIIEAWEDEALKNLITSDMTLDEKIENIARQCAEKSKDNYTCILVQINQVPTISVWDKIKQMFK